MKIAVDFDGTIVEHQYPEIGREMLFAFETLKRLQAKGHQLILWTYREGHYLDVAVEYCKKNGLEFYAVNSSYPEEDFPNGGTPRKLDVDLFIDDRNVGGFLGWGKIYQILHPNDGELNQQFENPEAHFNQRKKEDKGFLKRLFG